MTSNLGKRPAEIFGYPIDNLSYAATEARQQSSLSVSRAGVQ